jgi:hypothetical protein
MDENQRTGSNLRQLIHRKTKVTQLCLIYTYFELHRKVEGCKNVYNLSIVRFLKEPYNNPASYPTDTTGYYPRLKEVNQITSIYYQG